MLRFLDLDYFVGKRVKRRVVLPQHHPTLAQNGPDPAIAIRHRLVRGRGMWFAIRVRVVVTDHHRPAVASSAMSVDKRLRIDLEMRFGAYMDVCSGHNALDALSCSQQYAAAFARMGGASLVLDPFHHIPCHCDIHRAWP